MKLSSSDFPELRPYTATVLVKINLFIPFFESIDDVFRTAHIDIATKQGWAYIVPVFSRQMINCVYAMHCTSFFYISNIPYDTKVRISFTYPLIVYNEFMTLFE
jgi:hypothetical protein